jgi:hypothetical protein
MRRFMLLAAFLIACVAPATADDTANAQSIIRSQVEALSRDDGAAAYAFASPVSVFRK